MLSEYYSICINAIRYKKLLNLMNYNLKLCLVAEIKFTGSELSYAVMSLLKHLMVVHRGRIRMHIENIIEQ